MKNKKNIKLVTSKSAGPKTKNNGSEITIKFKKLFLKILCIEDIMT